MMRPVDPARDPGSWRRWVVGMALGVLLALVLLPGAQWIVAEQVRMQVDARGWNLDPGRIPELAAQAPSDFSLQLAVASQKHDVEAVRSLRERFPDEPTLYATILRFDMSRFTLLEPPVLENQDQPMTVRPTLHPDRLAEFEADAAAGERLDPDNGYFPLMRAVGEYAGGRPERALAAVCRAGEKTRWEEYWTAAVAAEWRLSDVARPRGALRRMHQASTVLSPGYGSLMTVTRWAIRRAAEEERAGRVREGMALRRAVARCGSRMRVQSRTAIGSMAGVAITRAAARWPGGVRLSERDEANRGERLVWWPQPGWRSHYPVEEYAKHLERQHERDEARWVRAEEQAGRRTEALVRGGREQRVSGALLSRLVACWVAGVLLLSNVTWLLGLGLAAALLARTRPIRMGRPLPATAVRGLRAAAAIVATVTVLLGSGIATALEMTLLTVLACGTAWGYALLCRRPLIGFLAVATGVPLLLLFLGMLLMGQTEGLVAYLGTARHVGALESAPTHRMDWTGDWLRFAALLVPFLTFLALTVASRVLQVPVSVGLVRGFRGAAVPLACLLLIAYGGTVLAATYQEERAEAGLERMVAHEGRFLAAAAGKAWPGAVAE